MPDDLQPRISTDPADLDIPLIHRFLSEESHWARGIAREVVEQGIGSSLNFGVFIGADQVGYARVVTDHTTFAWITDVFVLATHRGRGLSRLLVSTILAHPSVTQVRRVVLVSSSARGLYARLGFAPPAKPEIFMEIDRSPSLHANAATHPGP
jgi:GNAT superfamily N-acetyltransferase